MFTPGHLFFVSFTSLIRLRGALCRPLALGMNNNSATIFIWFVHVFYVFFLYIYFILKFKIKTLMEFYCVSGLQRGAAALTMLILVLTGNRLTTIQTLGRIDLLMCLGLEKIRCSFKGKSKIISKIWDSYKAYLTKTDFNQFFSMMFLGKFHYFPCLIIILLCNLARIVYLCPLCVHMCALPYF